MIPGSTTHENPLRPYHRRRVPRAVSRGDPAVAGILRVTRGCGFGVALWRGIGQIRRMVGVAGRSGGRRSTTWGKGQGGSKKRPPELIEVQELARGHSPYAVRRLLYWAKSKNAVASPRACEALLDRAFGKPPVAIHHSGRITTGQAINLDELSELQQRVLTEILLLPSPTTIDQEPE